MGTSSWSNDDFVSYSKVTHKNVSYDKAGRATLDWMGMSAQETFSRRGIDPELDPYNVTRECCNTTEHPDTKPVILALDVTGSMGKAAQEVASKLNVIMTKIYNDKRISDIEFIVMGIGDLAYDRAPIQMSQCESDIRIAEHLDKIYFEGGGGGNQYESYTAAWYMGLYHTKFDRDIKNGKKSLIITLGDETLNPYLPINKLATVTGDDQIAEEDVLTSHLFRAASQKFGIYHINVLHHKTPRSYTPYVRPSWTLTIGEQNYFEKKIDEIEDIIPQIITDFYAQDLIQTTTAQTTNTGDNWNW